MLAAACTKGSGAAALGLSVWVYNSPESPLNCPRPVETNYRSNRGKWRLNCRSDKPTETFLRVLERRDLEALSTCIARRSRRHLVPEVAVAVPEFRPSFFSFCPPGEAIPGR